MNGTTVAFIGGLIVGAIVGVFPGMALGAIAVPAQAHQIPACVEEDGNPDGLPCMWADPDTGRGFYVTSENYR